MSEYQRVAFRAIDGPVSKVNLSYMERQSSRAEITPWSFDNEYNYGDFRGNAPEMLRRGYDLHVHYANFGTRSLFIRFPHGLPNAKSAEPYFIKDSLKFIKDKLGPGRILCIDPFYESDELDELWEFDDIIDRLIPLRAEILDGDLRPLYLAHLAMAVDSNHDPEETREGPNPVGLGELSDAQRALCEFYGLDDSLIAAAAEGSPSRPKHDDPRNQHASWIASQSAATKDAWLVELLSDPHSTVKSEILAKFNKGRHAPAWPTVERSRTISELRSAADELEQKADLKAAEKSARERAKRLARMAADPQTFLRETEQLVAERSQQSYRQIGKLLVELREALAGTAQSGLAEKHAQKLKKENPTLRMLAAELRREGLLAK